VIDRPDHFPPSAESGAEICGEPPTTHDESPADHTPAAARARLRRGRVLIVGAGGLGAPAALQLAAAGVGTVGLVDGDVVDLSNLHRQIIYRTADLGRRKVAAAAQRLATVHPHVAIELHDERLTADNLAGLFARFDFIIDGTDHIASKYLVNDGAVLCNVPFSHAGVLGFQGQTMTVLPGRSACLRCLFPTPPPAGEIPTCQETGVIGALAGTMGVLQATEALKFLLGVGVLLTDRLLTHDALTGRWRSIPLARARHCLLCGDQPRIHCLEPIAGEPAGCRS
jgi:molybdopterin/thiamine biosynthesis adenylyltransferase